MLKKHWGTILLVMIIMGFLIYKFLPTPGIGQITTQELEERITTADSDEVIFIDVRENHEFNAGHIKGMNNMPLSSLDETYGSLPKDKEIVVICRSGSRSMQAAKLLQDKGYEKLVNVKGGMLDWNGAIVTP